MNIDARVHVQCELECELEIIPGWSLRRDLKGNNILRIIENFFPSHEKFDRTAVRTTKQIQDSLTTKNRKGRGKQLNHYIRVCQPLMCEEQDLPIPPYTLGVWLGDGDSVSGRVSFHSGDVNEISTHIENDGYDLHPIRYDNRKKYCCNRTIGGLVGDLRNAGLLKNKHIPEQYLHASYEQRLALLQGIMDTDGSVTPFRKSSEITLCNPRLMFDLIALLRTFGFKAKPCR